MVWWQQQYVTIVIWAGIKCWSSSRDPEFDPINESIFQRRIQIIFIVSNSFSVSCRNVHTWDGEEYWKRKLRNACVVSGRFLDSNNLRCYTKKATKISSNKQKKSESAITIKSEKKFLHSKNSNSLFQVSLMLLAAVVGFLDGIKRRQTIVRFFLFLEVVKFIQHQSTFTIMLAPTKKNQIFHIFILMCNINVRRMKTLFAIASGTHAILLRWIESFESEEIRVEKRKFA